LHYFNRFAGDGHTDSFDLDSRNLRSYLRLGSDDLSKDSAQRQLENKYIAKAEKTQ
jgi:hypothetical protein